VCGRLNRRAEERARGRDEYWFGARSPHASPSCRRRSRRSRPGRSPALDSSTRRSGPTSRPPCAPLTLDFFVDGEPVGQPQQVDFTPGIGHVLDVAALGLPGTGLSVRTHLSADIVPAFVEAEVSAG